MAWIDVNDRLPDLHDDVWEDGDEVVHYKVSDPVLFAGGRTICRHTSAPTAGLGWRKADDYPFALAWHKTLYAAAVFLNPVGSFDLETTG